MGIEYIGYGIYLGKLSTTSLYGDIGVYYYSPIWLIGAFFSGVIISYLALRRGRK